MTTYIHRQITRKIHKGLITTYIHQQITRLPLCSKNLSRCHHTSHKLERERERECVHYYIVGIISRLKMAKYDPIPYHRFHIFPIKYFLNFLSTLPICLLYRLLVKQIVDHYLLTFYIDMRPTSYIKQAITP